MALEADFGVALLDFGVALDVEALGSGSAIAAEVGMGVIGLDFGVALAAALNAAFEGAVFGARGEHVVPFGVAGVGLAAMVCLLDGLEAAAVKRSDAALLSRFVRLADGAAVSEASSAGSARFGGRPRDFFPDAGVSVTFWMTAFSWGISSATTDLLGRPAFLPVKAAAGVFSCGT